MGGINRDIHFHVKNAIGEKSFIWQGKTLKELNSKIKYNVPHLSEYSQKTIQNIIAGKDPSFQVIRAL